MKYQHVLSMIRDSPWCILAAKLDEIAAVVAARSFGTEEEISRRLEDWRARSPEDKAPRREPVTFGSVGVVPIMGTMVRRANLFTEYSGGTSMQMAAQTVAALAADPKIGGILLEIDSPGGTHDGTPELAAEVAKAAALKPVFASANGMSASAAYWVGSQATELAVAPSGTVGSIGTLILHMDRTEQLAKDGVKATVIRSSERKAEGNSLEPLTEETRARLQAEVDEIGQEFEAAVAAGRGVTPAHVRETFGRGGMFRAEEAKLRGMADRVEPVEETMARLLRRVSREGGGSTARAEIKTVRDFEAALRDGTPFSHSQAKAIASLGFKALPPRDEAQTETDGGLREAVSAFVSDIKSQSRGGK